MATKSTKRHEKKNRLRNTLVPTLRVGKQSATPRVAARCAPGRGYFGSGPRSGRTAFPRGAWERENPFFVSCLFVLFCGHSSPSQPELAEDRQQVQRPARVEQVRHVVDQVAQDLAVPGRGG